MPPRGRSRVKGARAAATEVDIRFVTPLGALFAISALVPLAVFILRRRRLRAIEAALGLEHATLGSHLYLALGLAAVPVLLGLAAAQPVIETTRTVPERTDAQAFVVLDVSRSMLASAAPGSPTRFERARAIALRLSDEFPDVPFGIASLVSGVLPHAFPTTDARVFAATLAKSVDPRHAPPAPAYLTLATDLNGLHSVPELNYFLPTATGRVLVVLTDGETQPIQADLARAFNRRPKVETIFVHVWEADERIYETGVAEGGYRADAGSTAALARAASLVGGQVIAEDDTGNLAAAVRELVGEGETVDRERETGRLALMPYLTLLAFVPLGFVLLRRNVWIVRRRRIEDTVAPAPRVSPAAAPVPTPAGVERAA